ncbi:hypothetical protein GCM10010231_64960 [Streptomyces sindenensis]|nr:hypothetical protein GCM10010231_64960 [Streptomyces sindenensis]
MCRAVVVAPDSLHAMFTGVPEGVLIQYVPGSRVGQWLACLTAEGGPGAWVRAGESLIQDQMPDDPALVVHAVERDLDASVGDEPTPGRADRHCGLARVLRTLPGQLAAGQACLGEAARVAGLSETRLTHLFRSQLGLPFRPYVLWRRLQRATELVAADGSLTEAAHGAGFANMPPTSQQRCPAMPAEQCGHGFRGSLDALSVGRDPEAFQAARTRPAEEAACVRGRLPALHMRDLADLDRRTGVSPWAWVTGAVSQLALLAPNRVPPMCWVSGFGTAPR